MKENTRRSRYKYEIRVNRIAWVQATTTALADAAAKAAGRSWARNSCIEVIELKNGGFSPFHEVNA